MSAERGFVETGQEKQKRFKAMKNSTQQRLAIVTGTSSGIGAAIASELLSKGWSVLGVARREVKMDDPRYRHVSLDLSDITACQAYFTGAFLEDVFSPQQDWSRLALINNAACLEPTGPLSMVDLAALQRALTINVALPAWLMGFVLSRGPKSVPWRMVNISSGAASAAYPGWGSYCMSKCALRMAGQVLAIEMQEIKALEGRQVKVIDYAPGVVDTPMQVQARSADPGSFPRVQKFIDLHRNGDLIAAREPAREIVQLLEQEELGAFSIHRFGA
jgi:benzil reductase ((S)-benzoin forming)